jgi:hypothetical protein
MSEPKELQFDVARELTTSEKLLNRLLDLTTKIEGHGRGRGTQSKEQTGAVFMTSDWTEDYTRMTAGELTFHDQSAIAAMQSLMTHHGFHPDNADLAFDQADAMVSERRRRRERMHQRSLAEQNLTTL